MIVVFGSSRTNLKFYYVLHMFFGNPPMNLGAPDQGLAPSPSIQSIMNFLVCFFLGFRKVEICNP